MAADTTIVVPCYNEAQRLDRVAFERFAFANRQTEFLFVDDGSSDGTVDVLETLHRSRPDRFNWLSLPHNMGKAEAVRQGVCHALQRPTKMVGFWDADLATPLDTIPDFQDVLLADPNRLMVVGARVKLLGRCIQRRPVRHYLGRIFATVASTLLALPIYDTQCGAKLFRANAEVYNLFAESFCTNWVFDVEILARLIRNRRADGLASIENCIYEFPLPQWRDVAGSKVRPRDFARAFFELLRIHRVYLRRADAPRCVLPFPGNQEDLGRRSQGRAA